MGDRRQPTPPPTNQRRPQPPPAPPPKRPDYCYDNGFVICIHGHRHGSIVAAVACGKD